MKRIPIDLYDFAGHILRTLPKGILLSTSANGEMDTMTIGWGSLGTDWSRPVFTVLVRESRHTKKLIEANPEFTINVPLEGADVRKIISWCGTRSGRDTDKFKDCELHVVPGEKVAAPAIAELPLTLECKVIYKQEQDKEAIEEDILKSHYPNGDLHTAYIGEIVNAYILEK